MIEDDGFSDISYEGGKYILEVDSWFDFSDLFLDVHSDYNSIGRDLAKKNSLVMKIIGNLMILIT